MTTPSASSTISTTAASTCCWAAWSCAARQGAPLPSPGTTNTRGSPAAPDTLRAAVAAACSSACVVDSGAAIGPYNRENLELLRAAAGAGVPVLTLRRERLESLEAARPFDTVRALMDEAARLAAGKGGGVCPSSGAASGAIAGTV